MSEFFSHLKEYGQAAKENGRAIRNAVKKTAVVDLHDLTADINTYRGRKVKVVGTANYVEDREPTPKPVFADISGTATPPPIDRTATIHTLSSLEDGGLGIRSSILFQETTDLIKGDEPLPLPRHEGQVVVTGRVKMEKARRDLGAALGMDELQSLGEVKVNRPYIKAKRVEPLE
jgi:hypothetical protein